MTDFHQSPTIEITNLSKQLGNQSILENITLQVPQGKIYGIRGVNGAGKSILLRVIAGLIKADKGKVTVFNQLIGVDVEFPQNTGVIIDSPGFLPHYSGLKNLELLAMIRKKITKEQIAETIHLVGLDPTDNRPVRTYSTGMRQRLGLAQAIMEKPRLLLLDEPTSAIDANGREIIYALLNKMRSEGVTMVVTSHQEEEILSLCDAVFEIKDQKLISYTSIRASSSSTLQ